ncbi:hypothetical protein BDE02_15G064000 [Populus trichocarpa]|nr:hypothetical protein BDE02_15G064000 [Populus trichocarpa]
MQESNIYSIWFSILSSPFHFVFGNLSFAWTVYNNVFSVISPSLLLFQIDYRKDVCLVAVAPPIEKLQRLSTQSFFGSFLSISAVSLL